MFFEMYIFQSKCEGDKAVATPYPQQIPSHPIPVGVSIYFLSKNRVFSKTQYSGFEFFSKNANVVFIEKSEFFLKILK